MGSPDHQYNLMGILKQGFHLHEKEDEVQETEQPREVLEESLTEPQESDVPLEELLALYGYEASDPVSEPDSEGNNLRHSLPDMTLDKEQIAKDLLPEEEEETQSSADDLTPSVTSHDASHLFPDPVESNSLIVEEKEFSLSPCDAYDGENKLSSEDESMADDCNKDMMVGPQYQAVIPPYLGEKPSEKANDIEDQLLWDPHVMPEKEVEEFLYRASKRNWEECDSESIPEQFEVKDNEQALYELVKCNYNPEEALRRLRFNVKVVQDQLCAWSEEECRHFEHGFRVHGKNFHLIQANKVRTRSVGECVEYYYLWKKSYRYDCFTQQTRFGRRKYALQSCSMDYADNDLESVETDDVSRGRSFPRSPSVTSCPDTHSNQDQLEEDNAESPDVENAICNAGSVSETDQEYKYTTSSVNTCHADCTCDSPSLCEDVEVASEGSAHSMLPIESALCKTAEVPKLTEFGTLSPNYERRQTELPTEHDVMPDRAELKNEPVTVTSGHVSLSVTDFAVIDIGDVERFLGGHTAHSRHQTVVHTESLSQ
ncbi:mesoderm induction early response protein 2 [Protopterus annectens]|uniref:mesoderm induction early response protein 2 n=1 Tax=Protopterus annectens TaxID=7888 RepID=UPI001CF9B65D|nr:mesoderm induction early response protein 2 [Protopterus annectens]